MTRALREQREYVVYEALTHVTFTLSLFFKFIYIAEEKKNRHKNNRNENTTLKWNRERMINKSERYAFWLEQHKLI